MALHQFRVMARGLWVYWRTYRDRNRVFSQEDDFPERLTEVQGLGQNETVNKQTLKIEMDKIDTKINSYKDEIIYALNALRKDMEKGEEKIITKLRGN